MQKITKNTYFKIGLLILACFLVIRYWGKLETLALSGAGSAMPLVIGAVLAYILNILMGFFETHLYRLLKTSPEEAAGKKKAVGVRAVSILLALSSLVIVAFLIVFIVAPELLRSVSLIVTEVPGALEKMFLWLRDSTPILKLMESTGAIRDSDSMQFVDLLYPGISFLGAKLSEAVQSVTGIFRSVFSALVNFFMSFIFSLYILSSKEKLGKQAVNLIKTYAGEKVYEKVHYVLGTLNRVFRSYIVGQCTEAIILGVLCSVLMMVFRFPYANMIGSLIAVTALIPVAGAYIGGAVGTLMIMTVSPVKGLLFLVFITVLQQVEGNLIYPRVVGDSIGLPGIWVLAAVVIGGGIFGVAGILLGVPVAATIYQLVKDDMDRKKQLQKTISDAGE